MDIFDILSGRAGRGGGGDGRPQRRTGEDVVFPLKVSLDDLYNGMTKKLRLTKNVICTGACEQHIKPGFLYLFLHDLSYW